LFFHSDSPYLYQINATNLSQIIKYYDITSSDGGYYADPIVFNKAVYVGDGNYNPYIRHLNASNISQVISSYTSFSRVYETSPVLNGYVYGATSSTLLLLNASNLAQTLSSISCSANSIEGFFPVSSNYVYKGCTVSSVNTIIQFNATNLSQQIATFPNSGWGYALGNDFLYFGSGSTIYQLNASNVSQQIANITLATSVSTVPAINYLNVFVSAGSVMYQLNASNVSNIIGSFTAGSTINGDPVIAKGFLYFGSIDNKLYQLGVYNPLPVIKINYPGDEVAYINVSEANYSLIQNSTFTWDNCWYSANYGASNSTTVAAGTNFVNITSIEGWNNLTVYCNDSQNIIYNSSLNYYIDVDYPVFINVTNQNTTDAVGLSYTIGATDNSGISCFGVNDSVNFKISCSGLLQNNTLLGVGLYWLNITANDSVQHQNSTLMWVNVTDGTYPIVNITYPLNNTNYSISISALNYSVSDNIATSSCWWSNNSGMWNSSSVSAGINWTGIVSLQGWNNWTVYCNDSSRNIGRANVRFIVDTIYPNVTLNSPADNYINNSFGVMNISFNCSAFDNFALKNISLYITNSSNSNFALNQTKNIAGVSANANWTLSLLNGNYSWNCLAYDSSGNSNFSANRTITINPDIVSPAFNNLTNQTIYETRALNYQINATDTFGISCFTVNDTTNFNINCSGYLKNNTVLAVGLYNLNITVNDTSNNINSTLMWVNVTLIPRIGLTLITPTRNLNVTQNKTFQVSVNVSCSNTDCGEINVSLENSLSKIYNFTTCSANGTYGPNQTQCNTNYTGTTLQGLVTINTQGYQEFIIPNTGVYLISAYGASGGTQPEYSSSVSYGALISGNITLNAGTRLIIVVGQRGVNGASSDNEAGSGGGTFIAYGNNYSVALPLIVAGGGSGAGSDAAPGNAYTAINGVGSGCTLGGACSNQNDGAGFYFNNSVSAGAKSFRGGGAGGNSSSGAGFGEGGFGGGAGGTNEDGSGGGGYTGGIGSDDSSATRGGASFVNTSLVTLSQNTTTGYDGAGKVSITFLGGIVSTNTSATPFYTTTQNPYNLSLNNGESQIITWTVNATGTMWNNYSFFVYANKTSDMSIGNMTSSWNVTITNETEDIPIVSIVFPQAANYNINISQLNYTISGNNLSSCWWSNSSGIWNSTIQNPGANWTGLTSNLGSNTWVVYCNNTNSTIGSSSVSFSIDGTAPTIILNSPAENYAAAIVGSANISFNCSASDNLMLKNISLFITNSSNSNFILNRTTNITGTNNNTNWTLSLGIGNFTWGCLAYDNLGNFNFSVNRTIWLGTNIAPNVTLNLPLNNSLSNKINNIVLNATISDYNGNLDNFTVWFYGGYANGTYGLINITYNITNGTSVTFNWTLGISGKYNWTAIANDGKANSTNYWFYFNLTNFSVSCEAGGPYQQNALVLVQGTIRNESIVVPNYALNVSVYNSNFNSTQNLTTASDGGFETSFSGLSVGNYVLNATATYKGYNETCQDIFTMGGSASFILDKIANIHNVTNTTINYNISLRLTNNGLSDATNVNITDSDSADSPYSLGNISANSSVQRSYIKSFERSSNYYAALAIASAFGIDPYTRNMIYANSSLINLSIPGLEIGQQLTLVKNAYYNSENSTTINYTLSIEVVNSGREDLAGITLIDSDLSLSTIISLNRTQNYSYSLSIIISKAASNTNKLFVKATATANSVTYSSNQINVRIPGYGGPADAIVYAPSSVNTATSFDSVISVENQNLDIGQDFTIDYWITNENENTNYSSGQQTIYVASSGISNLTATLTSPSNAGNYRLRTLVSWAGGTATSYDSFIVSSPAATTTPALSGGGSSGGGSITGAVISLTKPVININSQINNFEVEQGESLSAKINIVNLGIKEKVNATIRYFIIDSENNTIFAKTENISIEDQAELIKSFDIPDYLKAGEYKLYSEISYENQTSSSVSVFKVIESKTEEASEINIKLNKDKLYLFVIFVLLAIIIYFVFKSSKKFISFGAKDKIFKNIKDEKEKEVRAETKEDIKESSRENISLLGKMQIILLKLNKVKYWFKSFRKSNRLSNCYGKEVYSEEGEKIGKIIEIYIQDYRIYGWLVKIDKKYNKINRIRKVLIKHRHVVSIGHVMIIDKDSADYIKNSMTGEK
jgi:sporulation protein YlmC with PRC-barrel domain